MEERLELLQMEVAEQGREIQKLRRANEGLNELKEGMKECTLLLQGFRQQTTGVVAKKTTINNKLPNVYRGDFATHAAPSVLGGAYNM